MFLKNEEILDNDKVAIMAFEEADTPEANFQIGGIRAYQQRLDEAEEAWLRSQTGEAFYCLSSLYKIRGEIFKAKSAQEIAIEKLYNLDQVSEIINFIESTVKLYPEVKSLPIESDQFLRAWQTPVFYENTQISEAEEIFLRTLEQEVNTPIPKGELIKDLSGRSDLSPSQRVEYSPAFTTQEGHIISLIISTVANNRFPHWCRTKLSYIPRNINHLRNLKNLNLYGHSFKDSSKAVPSALKDLNKLKILQLAYNQLARIPEVIKELTNLRELNLSHNLIKTIPQWIFELPHLQVLHVSQSYINVIPKEIANLNNLKRLDISYTRISTIPEEILDLKNLEYLWIYKKLDPKATSLITKLKEGGVRVY